MATAEIKVDISGITEYVYEIGDLWKEGIGLPDHVKELADEIGQKNPPPGLLDQECRDGMLLITPGPKLNVLLALLRANRGQPNC